MLIQVRTYKIIQTNGRLACGTITIRLCINRQSVERWRWWIYEHKNLEREKKQQKRKINAFLYNFGTNERITTCDVCSWICFPFLLKKTQTDLHFSQWKIHDCCNLLFFIDEKSVFKFVSGDFSLSVEVFFCMFSNYSNRFDDSPRFFSFYWHCISIKKCDFNSTIQSKWLDQ